MKIIGAGFGRTGTASLKTALEMLGFAPCYHMKEVLDREKNPDHLYRWDAIGQGQPADWQTLFQDYQATVDWPAASYYRELMDVFPDAKVLLSVRDPLRWHESAMNTIFQTHPVGEPDGEVFQRMITNIIFQGTFDGKYQDPDYATRVFTDHIEQVKRDVPPERLLVYEVKEGWEPLCAFLDVPVPDQPFPLSNTTQEWNERFGKQNLQ